MYSEKQRKNVTKMIDQARKDIHKMEKKIDKIKLWLDVYETLALGRLEVVEDDESVEELIQEAEEEDPESY